MQSLSDSLRNLELCVDKIESSMRFDPDFNLSYKPAAGTLAGGHTKRFIANELLKEISKMIRGLKTDKCTDEQKRLLLEYFKKSSGLIQEKLLFTTIQDVLKEKQKKEYKTHDISNLSQDIWHEYYSVYPV